VPVWEEVQPEDVVVLKDIMASRREANDAPLQYNRIPITAEKPPDYSDLKEMIEVVLRDPPNTPIVVNCQLGRGRSTLATVRPAFIPLTKGTLTIKTLPQILLVLIREWLQVHQPMTPMSPRLISRSLSMSMTLAEPVTAPQRHSYQVINSKFFLFATTINILMI